MLEIKEQPIHVNIQRLNFRSHIRIRWELTRRRLLRRRHGRRRRVCRRKQWTVVVIIFSCKVIRPFNVKIVLKMLCQTFRSSYYLVFIGESGVQTHEHSIKTKQMLEWKTAWDHLLRVQLRNAFHANRIFELLIIFNLNINEHSTVSPILYGDCWDVRQCFVRKILLI
jgi:hypothetical protein